MKTFFLTSLACLIPTAALAQGLINFNNYNVSLGIDARVYITRVDGPLVGDTYYGQLFAGPTADSLAPIGVPVKFRNAASGAGSGRIVGAGAVEVPTVPSGKEAFVQMRAWEVARGTSYEGVIEDTRNKGGGWVLLGLSNVIKVRVDGGLDNPTGFPADLLGLRPTLIVGVYVPPIPEPSTLALCALGAAAFLLRRRAS